MVFQLLPLFRVNNCHQLTISPKLNQSSYTKPHGHVLDCVHFVRILSIFLITGQQTFCTAIKHWSEIIFSFASFIYHKKHAKLLKFQAYYKFIVLYHLWGFYNDFWQQIVHRKDTKNT